MDDGKLLPMGMEGTRYLATDGYCSKISTSGYSGIGCAYKAVSDPNYWKNLH